MKNNLSEFSDDRDDVVDHDRVEEALVELAEFAIVPSDPAENQTHRPPAQTDSPTPPFVRDHFQPMDPRNISVETIALLILSCVAMFVAVGLSIYAYFDFGFGWVLAGSTAVAAAGVFCCVAFAFFWPRLEYKWTRFRIDPAGVEIHHGVFWRHQVCVPIGRVQHADVSQGPLQRMNGVATLTMHTAGTANASVSLEGLNHQMAIDIRDWIVHQRKSHDAV